MKIIVIHAHSRPLINGKPNPKNYPYWKELITELLTHHGNVRLIQIGLQEEPQYCSDFRTLPLKEIKKLLMDVDGWVAVESFLPHLAARVGKPGVVIMGQSDPNIYGYDTNINLYKKEYLRKNQFDVWTTTPYIIESFPTPSEVIDAMKTLNII